MQTGSNTIDCIVYIKIPRKQLGVFYANWFQYNGLYCLDKKMPCTQSRLSYRIAFLQWIPRYIHTALTFGCIVVIIQEYCTKRRYQGYGQVIASHIYCGVYFLIPAHDTCFWLAQQSSYNGRLSLYALSYDCPGVCEATLNNMGRRIVFVHSKSTPWQQQREAHRNRVHILLYIYIIKAWGINVSWSICDELGVTGVSYWPYKSIASQ